MYRQKFEIEIDYKDYCADVERDNKDYKIRGEHGDCDDHHKPAICQSFCKPPVCSTTIPQRSHNHWIDAEGSTVTYEFYLFLKSGRK